MNPLDALISWLEVLAPYWPWLVGAWIVGAILTVILGAYAGHDH